MTETATVTQEGSELGTKGIKVVQFDGVIESAYGVKLDSPLTYETSFEEIQTYEAIPAKELPDQDDVLTLVNNKRKANARQKAMQKAMDDAGIVKPTLETSEDLRIKGMVESMVASKKYTREQAIVTAKSILGIA